MVSSKNLSIFDNVSASTVIVIACFTFPPLLIYNFYNIYTVYMMNNVTYINRLLLRRGSIDSVFVLLKIE